LRFRFSPVIVGVSRSGTDGFEADEVAPWGD
jgi:hypothetical protein